MSPSSNLHFNALDGLRGFAVLVGFLSHISNDKMHILPGLDFSGIGKSGVYLFFILSSFLLSYPLLNMSYAIFNKTNLLNYGKRRFLRIYPLYSLYLICGLISTWFFINVLGITEHAVPFPLSPSEFTQHILLQAGKGVTWSIAVEFKFYIVLPFLAYLITSIAKRGRILAVTLIIILCILSFFLFPAEQLRPNDTRLSSYSIVFLTGTLLAFFQLHFVVYLFDVDAGHVQ